MDFLYDIINVRPQGNYQQNLQNSMKNKRNGKGKLIQHQGQSSSRKQNTILQNREKMNILTPIDHSTLAKNIYFGQIRHNPQQQQIFQTSQFINNQSSSNTAFYQSIQSKDLQINQQSKITQEQEQQQQNQNQQLQQEYLDIRSYQRHKTDSETFKQRGEERINNQIILQRQQINQDELNLNRDNSNNHFNNQQQSIESQQQNQLQQQQDQQQLEQNQLQLQLEQNQKQYTQENNENYLNGQDTLNKQEQDQLDDCQYSHFDMQQSNALNHNQGSMNVNNFNQSNISNTPNQFRISKSKNGLRTPKYNNNQKQLIQQYKVYEVRVPPKDQQYKSKSQQKNRTKPHQKGPSLPKQPDTYEMLRDAQNRLKTLQQSRLNNYNELKYTSDIKSVYNNLNAPLSEISNMTSQQQFQGDSNKLSQTNQNTMKQPVLMKQNTIVQQNSNVENKKRGSCFAKLNTALTTKPPIENNNQSSSFIPQQSLISQQQNSQQMPKSQQQQNQQQIHPQQNSLKNISINNQNSPIMIIQQNNVEQQLTPQQKQNGISKTPSQHQQLMHANSSIFDYEKIQKPIDQSKLLNCPRKQVDFSEEDKKIYGDRFIDGYQKLNLLGKGGFALVWLAKQLKTGMKVAIKQICKVNGSDSHAREMRVNTQFFENDGTIKDNFTNHSGMNNLLKCYEIRQTPKDIFIVYELGGGSLSNFLYEIKGEFYKSERVYKINFTELHNRIFQTQKNSLLRSLLRNFFNALNLLQSQKIVHCDVKPENILVELDNKGENFEKVYLIDFGSCFSLKDTGSVGMATPEYLPPEILDVFSQKFNMTSQRTQIEQLAKVTNPWSIDMWSMGAVLLEILTGLPHWLAYKCRVVDKQGKSSLKQGLFSTKGQDYEKIIQKQQQFCDNFNNNIKDITKQFDCQSTGKRFQDLLKKMMKFNAIDRISPQQALEHSFFDMEISASDLSSLEGINSKI